MKVSCSVDFTTLENEDSREVEGVIVTCDRCDHTTESYGHGPASVRRCLALMREECPMGEENFYTSEDDD